MNLSHMKKLCPESRFLGIAFLDDYKFVFDIYSDEKYGEANIVKEKGSIVYGALFDIGKKCLKNLDSYEEYPEYYKRRSITVKRLSGEKVEAIVYYREPLKRGIPEKNYYQMIIQGARDCGIDEEYIKENITSLVPY